MGVSGVGRLPHMPLPSPYRPFLKKRRGVRGIGVKLINAQAEATGPHNHQLVITGLRG